jgi:EmrB/QacA subfamily drug resistance transporter
MTAITTDSTARSNLPTIIGCSLVSFMVGLDALVVTTVLPYIRAHFAVGQDQLSWTVNSYTLTFAVAILVGTTLGDRLGRRTVYMVAVVLFALSSATCALSPTFGWFVAARVVQGAAGGVAAPLALSILTVAFPSERRGRVLGLWGAITGLSVAVGPLVGGAIAQSLTWEWVFWLNVPVAVLIFMVSLRIPRDARTSHGVDLLGLILAAVGIVLLVHALVRIQPGHLTDVTVWIEGAAGLVVLAGFATWQTRAKTPVVPPVLFSSHGFTAALLATAALGAGLYGSAFVLSQYIAATIAHDPLHVGLALLPWTGLAILVAPIAGRLSDRIGEGPLLTAGLSLQALGAFLITLLGGTNYLSLFGPLIVSGVGVAIAFPTSATAIMRPVSRGLAGAASGVGNAARQVGAAAGVASAIAVFSLNGSLANSSEATNGLHAASLALAVIGALGAGAAATINGKPLDAPRADAALTAAIRAANPNKRAAP